MNIQIITLYRYFAMATHMRELYQKTVTPEMLRSITDSQSFLAYFWSAPGVSLCYAYSGVFIVIEGWRDLKFKDLKIDTLLASPYVDRLRRFRNATFHYQPEILRMKHVEFFGTEEEQTEVWFNELYGELERYFRENSLPTPDELKEKLKDATLGEIAAVLSEYWAKNRMASKE